MAYVVLVGLLLGGGSAEAPDTVVVCPRPLREALQPWVRYRVQQGHRIALVSSGPAGEAIRAEIRRAARGGELRYVLLVGDAAPSDPAADGEPDCLVPTGLVKAKVNVRYGSEPEIATDNWYADLDDDAVPDVAVGRLTADTPEELARMVRKTLAYEQRAGWGLWRRRINLVAGAGGFGKLIDTVLERATRKFLTSGLPAGYQAAMTYASWQSPYCPDPRRFHQAVVDRLNEGCLFWVYIGHGGPQFLDQVRVPAGRFPILGVADMHELRCRQGAPIAVLLSCYCGAFDGPRDCLAEQMLRAPGGPVAVLCASRVTMPYGMAVIGDELLTECFRRRPATLGQLLLRAKRRTIAAEDGPDDGQLTNRRMLDALASALSPSAEALADQRAEHVLLLNLLGDPLLRLHHPRKVPLSVPETIEAGGQLPVAGVSPLSGRCTVELVCRRDRLRFAAPVRRQFNGADEALAAYDRVYRQANDQRWSSRSLAVGRGPFRTELPIPEQAHGPSHVRVFIEGDADFAIGEANVLVRRPNQTGAR